MKKQLYNFSITNYNITNPDNLKINNDSRLVEANIRPFGKWLEDKFPDNKKINNITYHGIFALSKKDIINKPKDYYLKFYNEVDKDCSPEVVHYIERSWFRICNTNNPIIIKYYLNYIFLFIIIFIIIFILFYITFLYLKKK